MSTPRGASSQNLSPRNPHDGKPGCKPSPPSHSAQGTPRVPIPSNNEETIEALRNQTFRIPSMQAFKFFSRTPVPPSSPGWQRKAEITSAASGEGDVVPWPSLPRFNTQRPIALLAKYPQYTPVGEATDPIAVSLYARLEHQARLKKASRSTVLDCEAILAELKANAGSVADNQKLEAAVACMIMAKVTSTCFQGFEGITSNLLRIIYGAVYEDISKAPATDLTDINYIALESFRDRQERIQRLEEALQKWSNDHASSARLIKGFTMALNRRQQNWLYLVFKSWRDYTSLANERDERFIAYVRHIVLENKKTVSFFRWIKFTLSRSRRLILQQTYGTNKKLLEQVEELKMQCTTKENELLRFRQTRDNQSQKLCTLEEACSQAQKEYVKATSRTADLENQIEVLKELVADLGHRYGEDIRSRRCVIHNVMWFPQDLTLSHFIVMWLNHIFKPCPPVQDLSRDMANGDVLIAVYTALTDRKIDPDLEGVHRMEELLKRMKNDVIPPLPSNFLLGITAQRVLQGHEMSILSLCVAFMHHFVYAPQRTPLIDAFTLGSCDSIQTQLESMKGHHERLHGWEQLLSTAQNKLHSMRRYEVLTPHEIMVSSSSVNYLILRALNYYQHPENREAVQMYGAKLWRCVVHCASLQTAIDAKTSVSVWMIGYLGWQTFTTDHGYICPPQSKDTVEHLFTENSVSGSPTHAPPFMDLDGFFRALDRVLDHRGESLRSFLAQGLHVDIDFEAPIRTFHNDEAVHQVFQNANHPSWGLYKSLLDKEERALSQGAFLKFCKNFRAKVETPPKFRAINADPFQYTFRSLLHCQHEQELTGLSLQSFQCFLLMVALWTERSPWDSPVMKLESFMKEMKFP